MSRINVVGSTAGFAVAHRFGFPTDGLKIDKGAKPAESGSAWVGRDPEAAEQVTRDSKDAAHAFGVCSTIRGEARKVDA